MSDTAELIVKFRRGVSEDDARNAAERAGGKVRRRMRADHDDEVMLLLRVEGDLSQVKGALDGHQDVEMTEENKGGYGVL